MDRRHFLTSVAAFVPTISLANAPLTAERPVLRKVTNTKAEPESSARLLDPGLSENTGYTLIDNSTGEVLDSYQPELALPPASVTKIITAVYARSILGPDYRFVTRLVASGPVVEGIVQGDIYLVGGGDPALDTDELGELAEAAVAAGVHGLTGQFYVDDSVLPKIAEIDDTQPDHLGYNPSICGLNLNFNRVYFEWKRTGGDYDLTLDARGLEYKPLVKWVDIRAEDRGAPVFKHWVQNGHDKWSVSRSALGKGGGRWLPVRQPADYVGEVFKTVAAHAGLSLPEHQHAVAPTSKEEIARFESKHLDEVLRWMLKYSNNLTAECLGLMASQKLGYTPQSLSESAAKMGYWAEAHLGISEASFENHSGLTDQSRINATQMVALMSNTTSSDALAGLLRPVKLLDRRGNLMDTNGVDLVAKTGTLNYTRGLAGYLDKGERKYSFAIFAADLDARAALTPDQLELSRSARTWGGRAKRQEQALLRHWLKLIS